jgi:penicillin-insensitive murein DD-endopeptidase
VRFRRWTVIVGVAGLAGLLAGHAPTGPTTRDPRNLPASTSTSIGGPNHGRLEGGVALPMEGPTHRFNPRRDARARYGTVEMVSALLRAADVVHRELPGGQLTVNDLSYPEGGPIPHHGSHRSGRDVDVLFYLLDGDGRPFPSVGAPLDPAGRGVDFRDLADPTDDEPVRIDLPRTWRFVQALLEDDAAQLQRIFVAEHLRTLLLRQARETGAPAAVVRRFGQLTCQPSYPHDDHFHFRFFCSVEDIEAGCEDARPIYPWHRRLLHRAGVKPVIEGRKPRAPKPDITTHEEARAEAGPMHADVEAWLERRKAWLRPPRTGRPWCR